VVKERESLCDSSRGKNKKQQNQVGAFNLYGKTGCSGGKSNGAVLFTGNFWEQKEFLQRYS